MVRISTKREKLLVYLIGSFGAISLFSFTGEILSDRLWLLSDSPNLFSFNLPY